MGSVMRQPESVTRGLATTGRRTSVLMMGVLFVGAGFFGGCAKPQAATIAEIPPLSVPAPPERVLVPVDMPIASAEPEPESPATPPRATPRPTPPRRPNPAPTAAATEPERAAETANATPEPPRPVSAQTPADAAAEKKVRDVLARATRDINRVNYQRLSEDGRTQYEQSKRFTDQAEQELTRRNYPYAMTIADKAAALANALLGN